MVWPALIGAGTSLLGGLFGRSKEKRERRQALEDREYARGHYKRLVKDASAAGFNPLTALRNGGGAGYASSSAPILSSGGPDPMQTALSQVGNYIANFDPHADTAREKSYALLDAQIRNLNASSGAIFPAMPGGFHSPGTYGGTFEGRPSGRAGALSGVTSVELDGFSYGGTGEGGVIEDMWVAYRRPDGSYVRVPNPNLPDGEQLLIPPIATVENATTRPVLSGLKSPNAYGLAARKYLGDWWHDWTRPWRENVR